MGGHAALPILLPWEHGGEHQCRDHQVPSTVQDIRRGQRCGKTAGVNPLQPETPSQHSPAPHSQRGHVNGPTSSCAGACWAGRRQSQASPSPSRSWPVGDPWPSFPAQPPSFQTPCRLLPFDAETISISSVATAPRLASAAWQVLTHWKKSFGVSMAAPSTWRKTSSFPPAQRAAEQGAVD